MGLRFRKPITWAQNASLSSFWRFGADAPNCLVLPTGFQGARVCFVGTEGKTVDGTVVADDAAAQDLYDQDGQRVGLVLPTSIPAAGVRIAFWPGAIAAQEWIGLRSVDAAFAAVTQSAAREGAWLFPFPSQG